MINQEDARSWSAIFGIGLPCKPLFHEGHRPQLTECIPCEAPERTNAISAGFHRKHKLRREEEAEHKRQDHQIEIEQDQLIGKERRINRGVDQMGRE